MERLQVKSTGKTDRTDAGRKKSLLLQGAEAALEKVKSRKGESIAESLLSILIAALGVVAFVTLLTGAARIIQNSGTAMDTYYRQMTAMEKSMAGQNSEDTGSNSTAKLSINLFGTTEKKDNEIPVNLYKAEGSKTMQLYAYSRQKAQNGQ